ncbi:MULTISPECIES: GNAT family N-acetyltransferase [Pseudomonas]|jgi:GNAT superfamily N-acetyltransferase|uniref:GNAT family N-acetyltransferase n=1 Tax=Pseudomonas TaxID=286 RepID=UPI0005FB1C33|nr:MULTISPECIES: GNAT family N-acetyltransferase [Pseudomonas]KJZ33472.1 GCN5 family acetyltransferase [Pseudomonas fluorescens]OOG15325.1 GNAT family N-acetyltransferase [Pseudomonas sp. C9]
MFKLVYRRYQPGDGSAVSQLFREVYGDHYARPDVYLPNMISQHNADGHWTSMLAVDGERVLGHAALCHDTLSDTTELALSVVHPAAQGRGISSHLSRELLFLSQAQGVKRILIKQVTHHPYTQRMAFGIGFHSTGLLPDYAPSPLTAPLPETIVIGCYAVEEHARPLPDLAWPESCRRLMQRLSAVFGTCQLMASPPSMPLQIRQHYQRYVIVIHRLNERLLDQLWRLPGHWLICAKLQLSQHFTEDLQRMTMLGFTFTGLMPAPGDHGWFALFHRGARPRHLSLHCPDMQQLHDDLQRNVGALDTACSAA